MRSKIKRKTSSKGGMKKEQRNRNGKKFKGQIENITDEK